LNGTKRRLFALGAAGLAAGAMPLPVALANEGGYQRELMAIFGPLIGWAFIGTGLLAWMRRPENRVGLLMIAVGFSWCASTLIASDQTALFITGYLTIALPYAILYHLLLAFPDGRLHSTLERVLVVAGYFSATVLKVIETMFEETAGTTRGYPENPLLITSDENLWIDVVQLRPTFGVLLALGVVMVLVWRWRAARGPQRRALTPVLVAGSLVTALLALYLGAGVIGISEVRNELEIGRIAVLAMLPFAYLGGLIHSRVVGGTAVSKLIARLGDQGRRVDVRDELAQALDDPSLALAYWLPEKESYVDAAGRAIDLPLAGSGQIATTVERAGKPIAAVIHDSSLADQRELVRAAGTAASLVLENERLEAELRAKVEELRASRARIVESSDDACRRIERDLHDGAQQRLVSMALNLRLLGSSLDANPEARRELESVRAELRAALEELRELARGIHPPMLSDRGLDAVLEGLVHRAPLPVELGATPGERLPERIESTTYFVVSEALTNVAKYSRATHARVDITRENGSVVVEVSDDGVGGADPAKGSGLLGLGDRVAAIDGKLEVESPPGQGTTVKATLPCV